MAKTKFACIQWTGDHYAMEAICDLGIGVMEHENGYDLEIDHKDDTLTVRQDQFVVMRNNKISVSDKRVTK